MRRKPWLVFLSFFITLNTLFFYGFVRDGTWLVIALLLIPVYYRVGYVNFFIGSLAFLGITLALILVFRLGFHDKIYSQAQQMLLTSDSDGRLIYKKNSRVELMRRHGDLKGLADEDDKFDAQPHRVKFRVDSFGFRNDTDYNNEKYVLVGDSFIAGANNSQEDIFSSQIRRKYRVKAYNLAIQGDIPDYVYNVKKFERKYGGNFKVLLFVFEGNDFESVKKQSAYGSVRNFKRFYKKYLRIYKRFFKETDLYRYTFIAYKSLTKKKKEANRVTELKIKNHRIAVFNDYLRVTQRRAHPFPEDGLAESIRSIRPRLAAIIFIPAKYRVYYGLMEPRPVLPLPHAQWEHIRSIAERLAVRAVDLTQPLAQESKRLLIEKNELTYWADDTHWNANGISVAVDEVCRALKELKCSPLDAPPANRATPLMNG
ncbi:MAG: hypothetical protein ACE5G9_08590 [Nitrospinales bacterium]